jgi:hypothetical protein
MSNDVVIYLLIVYAISSMWLFSPGTALIREWWIDNTKFLSALGYCQLCCSFWIGIAVHLIFFKWEGALTVIAYAFASSGVSWLLGSVTGFFLWGKMLFEDIIFQEKR